MTLKKKKIIILLIGFVLLAYLTIYVIYVSNKMIKEIDEIQIVDSDINELDTSIFSVNILMRVIPEKRYEVVNIPMPYFYKLDSDCYLYFDKVEFVAGFEFDRDLSFTTELSKRQLGKIYTFLPSTSFKNVATSFYKSTPITKINLNVESNNVTKEEYDDSLYIISISTSNFNIKYNNADEVMFEKLTVQPKNALVAFLKRTKYVYTIIISSDITHTELRKIFFNTIRIDQSQTGTDMQSK
jgi:hypothetical protein